MAKIQMPKMKPVPAPKIKAVKPPTMKQAPIPKGKTGGVPKVKFPTIQPTGLTTMVDILKAAQKRFK